MPQDPKLKSNVLPFPALRAAPRDPPQPSAWHVLGLLAISLVTIGLLGLTIWALIA